MGLQNNKVEWWDERQREVNHRIGEWTPSVHAMMSNDSLDTKICLLWYPHMFIDHFQICRTVAHTAVYPFCDPQTPFSLNSSPFGLSVSHDLNHELFTHSSFKLNVSPYTDCSFQVENCIPQWVDVEWPHPPTCSPNHQSNNWPYVGVVHSIGFWEWVFVT